MTTLKKIHEDIKVLKEKLVEKTPGHFGLKHFGTAFFGALFFGFTFVLKGLLFDVGLKLDLKQLIIIVIMTFIILSIQIYFIGYLKVQNRKNRPFGQFWAKRIIAYYSIAVITSTILLYSYGIFTMAGSFQNIIKLIIAVSFPAAIGAGAGDLLGKY